MILIFQPQAAQHLVESIQIPPDVWFNLKILIGVMFLLILVKQLLEDFIFGILWFFRSDFNNRDIILFDDKWCRLVHIGFTRTEFNELTIELVQFGGKDEAKITAGYAFKIANAELRRHIIKKQLPRIEEKEIERIQRSITTRKDDK